MNPVSRKGKAKAEESHISESTEESDSESGSTSDSSSETSSSDESVVTSEYLESLLAKARANAAARAAAQSSEDLIARGNDEEEIIVLDNENKPSLPPLDPGLKKKPYIEFGKDWSSGPVSIRDPDIELAEMASSSRRVPAPPIPPPELTKSGKPLTKKERKALKAKTAGPGWFDLPAPSEADLPRLYREVEALRLRNHLDPKRFYRKDEGEGKGIKGLPKYFAIGTILPSTTPFGTASGENLTRANRKRTLVDELVDDAEAKRYAKKKFEDLQSVRGAAGRNTLHAKRAKRTRKF